MASQHQAENVSSAHSAAADDISFGAHRIGAINWLGLYTLYARECRRFVKVWSQTLGAPAVTTVLFMIIFSLAFGGTRRVGAGIEFATFLAPGLMMMAMIQNSFANTSSSLIIAKVQGNIVDTLMPPLSATEMTLGFIGGGVTRGLLVGASVCLVFTLMPGVTVQLHSLAAILYFAVAATVLLSALGALTGIWADKFDNAAAITNFIISPLSLLSGTFYSISRLSDFWQDISRANPFFYLIDGFRYGFVGQHDSNLMIGVTYTLLLNAFFVGCVWLVFRRGYKLKA